MRLDLPWCPEWPAVYITWHCRNTNAHEDTHGLFTLHSPGYKGAASVFSGLLMKALERFARQAKSSLEGDCPHSFAGMSDVNIQNGRQFAVSCGLETKSAPFTTVTSAFYAYSRLLRSSEIAVWDLSSNKKGRKITYQCLAAHVQALSRHLAKLGVGRGHRIPLIATQGLESVVGILAVLSCGAQFIPIDYNLQTDDYIQATVAWSGQDVVLSTSPAADDVLMRLFANTLEVVRIYLESVQFPNLEHYPATHDQANADDICYTTFTSGRSLVPDGHP